MGRDPDFRYYEARAGQPSDDLTKALMDVLADAPHVDLRVQYAYDLYRVLDHRAAMDAFSLARADHASIVEALEVPVDVITAYQHLFFDVRVFRNKLERITYAQQYPAEEHRGLMESALEAGVDYLRWAYNAPLPTLSPRTIVRKAMVDTYFRSMAHRGNHISSDTSKQALKWFSTAVKNASIMEEVEPATQQRAVEQLKIALAKDNSVLPAENGAVTPGSVLH
jgi:hypothetical protein